MENNTKIIVLNEETFDEKNVDYLTINVDSKITLTFLDKNNKETKRVESKNWEHKGAPLGKFITSIIPKNNSVKFINLNFKQYDISQPDFLIERIFSYGYGKSLWTFWKNIR
ncbi:hypothetical protein [Spiroplasma endosymbiont of Glossina fuscipes fuscipes]|uniref:hypothetical protein n=1 Tax=Spiroplasma endosymbiont of Glossina fuscipes fuscipes TaxID=2004463 RepID=UPI003CED0C47